MPEVDTTFTAIAVEIGYHPGGGLSTRRHGTDDGVGAGDHVAGGKYSRLIRRVLLIDENPAGFIRLRPIFDAYVPPVGFLADGHNNPVGNNFEF